MSLIKREPDWTKCCGQAELLTQSLVGPLTEKTASKDRYNEIPPLTGPRLKTAHVEHVDLSSPKLVGEGHITTLLKDVPGLGDH